MKTIIAIIAMAAACAHAAGPATVTNQRFACQSADGFKRLVKLAVQDDKHAFSKTLTDGLISGQCTILNRGDTVHIEDVEIMDGMYRVRRPGEGKTFWTFREVFK